MTDSGAQKQGQTGHLGLVHYQPCVKVSVFFNKHPDMPYDVFYRHWGTIHAELTVASKAFNVFKVERYTQHHSTPQDKETMKEMGFKTLEFDACSTLWCHNYEDFQKMMQSTHAGPLADDAGKILDGTSITFFAGRDVIAFGKAIPGVDDKDGVVERPQFD